MKSEKEWVDQLYEVRCEPDKLLIMITNRRQELKNAALAELEKPGEALEAVEKWSEEYYGHSVLVGDIHRSLAVAFTAFAESYHAKKCAECKERYGSFITPSHLDALP